MLARVIVVWLVIATASPSALPAGAIDPLHRVEASRMSMACLYSIVAYGTDSAALARTLERALDEVDRIDRLMSHYRADSPLSRVNREAARAPAITDPELFDFIADAIGYSIASGGAFDITVGPLMKAWGFFRGDGRIPAGPDLERARQVTGFHHIVLNRERRAVSFDRDGVEIDLGGIAKGYAVDRVVELLKASGVTSALVSAGGSTLYALGAPPDAEAWTVEVQDPLDVRKVAFDVPLTNRALSVSGSSEKSFEMNGVRYSHIMNPRTGLPVQGVLTVVVLASSGTAGDALDNALFVQGVEGGRTLIAKYPSTDAIFLLPDGHGGWTSTRVER